MTLGSLFSGIGGFDLGFKRAGFEIAWQVEIEPFCRKVLEKRFPKAKRFEDVTKVGSHDLERVDVICAGVPCQDVSVAGKRAGLAGERTGLFYEFARILREIRPSWFVFENVPGLFSSNQGRDFGEILRVLMVECGYGVAWRVLDSQFFGVAQRRRRVFIVGRFGEPCPTEVLFERESCRGDFTEGGETGTDIAFALAASVRGTGDGHGQGWNTTYVAGPLKASSDRRISAEDAAGSHIVPAISSKWAKRTGGPAGDECQNLVAATLNSGGNNGGFRTEPGERLIAIQDVRGMRDKKQNGIGISEDGAMYTLDGTSHHAVAYGMDGQRNGEQLCMGEADLPDIGCPSSKRQQQCTERRESWDVSSPSDADRVRDFAGLPKGLDSARYRALGNAVTVNVAEWIARRIMED